MHSYPLVDLYRHRAGFRKVTVINPDHLMDLHPYTLILEVIETAGVVLGEHFCMRHEKYLIYFEGKIPWELRSNG